MSNKIIRDVAGRTKGEVYLGVVGSVRSGKSTFIRRFVEKKVLPYIGEQDLYAKIQDELPQSAEGKTIMTVEPKFVPSNNVQVTIDETINFNIRLVDCVGYVIPSAKGFQNEDGTKRLVKTPWFSEDIPFEEAAALGTKKVIESHSHIGVVMTSDGSIGDFKREEYEVVEAKIISQMQELGKPFVVVLNTKTPSSKGTQQLITQMSEKYQVVVLAIDVLNMKESDIDELLKHALEEFEIGELNIQVPNWVDCLHDDVSFKQLFNQEVAKTTSNYRKLKEVFRIQNDLQESGLFEKVEVLEIDPGTGLVEINVDCGEDKYLATVEELVGEPINDKGRFIELLQEFAAAKSLNQKIGQAMKMVDQCGYGIAMPQTSDMVLETPELLKQSGRYGIKIQATAPAIQLVKVDVMSTFEPIIGSLEQSQALVDQMKAEYLNNPDKLWNSEFFGRKLCDVINDGIKMKIQAVPQDVQYKFKESLSKVINKGKGGIIAIVL